MTLTPDVDRLIRETRRYEFNDGLRDLQLALLFGLGGVTVWLVLEPAWMGFVGRMAATYGRWAAWIGMVPTVISVLVVLGALRVMNVVRRRWLWRESGMVSPARWAVPRRINVLSAAILLAGVAVGFGLMLLGAVDQTFLLRMLWAATGWGFGYTLVAMGRILDLARYVRLGWVGGVLSTGILLLALPFGQLSLAFGVLWFVLLGGSGLLTLRRAAQALGERQPA
jgi:hypothetical protein